MTRTADPAPSRTAGSGAPHPPQPPWWRSVLLAAGVLVSLLLMVGVPPLVQPRHLSYSQFLDQLRRDHVETVTINPHGLVTGTLRGGTRFTTAIPTVLDDPRLAAELTTHHVQVDATAEQPSLLGWLVNLAPALVMLGLFVWLGRVGTQRLTGGWPLGRRTGTVELDKRPTTRFADVAGYEPVKRDVAEIVDYLRDPGKYQQVGARGPRGVLLAGPPGTGKTLLARALAGEAEVPFYAVTGSAFVELFVGMGAARIRQLFTDARKKAPTIIFIDEIDAIGARRSTNVALGVNDEREQTLNQLLAEMDGFDDAGGVVVIAATNRPETLDPALLRPGRFDRHVTVGLPELPDRRAILAVHTRNKPLAADVDLDLIARGTPGFAGADLANLVNEAAINAVRHGRSELTAADFDDARDRILLGPRRTNALLDDERHAVAVHEAGHALVAALSPLADPVRKVSILPAGMALGVTEQVPATDRHLHTESYLRATLAVRLGGRAAERLVCGEVSSGAANDLASATDLATRMVREFGMSADLGPIGYPGVDPTQLAHPPYAPATQRAIDVEVARLLADAEHHAIALLEEHRNQLDELVNLLLEQETVDGQQVYDLLARAQARTTAA